MCCMVAPGVEAMCAVRWHQEWKQYVLFGGIRSGSNICCKVAPGMEAICAVWWHQEWKQYVPYGDTRNGSKFLYCLVCLNMYWHHHTCIALSTGGLDFEVDTTTHSQTPKAQMLSSRAYRKSLMHAIFLFSGCIQ